jgi:hypothetical protein
MPDRGLDLAVAPRCRTCQAELQRIVSDRTDSEHKIDLKCAACGTLSSYVGPGLILDRRQGAQGADQ